MRKLPYDICRCHDAGCPQRESCLRWLCRTDEGDHIVQSPSLFPYGIPLGSPCPNRIRAEEAKENAQ